MKGIFIGIFTLIFLSEVALGQNLVGINQNHIPESRIQMTHEVVSPSWQLVWDRAREMVEKNKLEGAIALYRELLKKRQGLIEARWELALLLIQTNREKLAILELEDIVEARPNDLQALFILTGLLSNYGQCDKAISTYKRLQAALKAQEKIPGSPRTGPDIPKATSLLRLQEDLAVCLESAKRYSESIYYLRKALSLEPHRKALEFMLARELLATKKAKASLPYFTDLLPHYIDDANFLSCYAKALLAVGDRDRAMKVLGRIVRLSNKDNASWAIGELVRLHLMDRDIQSAIDLLERELRSRPDILNRKLLATLGRLYFASRRYLKSIQIFKTLVKEEPDDIEGLTFMARAYESLQLFAPAISIYGKVSFLRPDRETSLHLLRLLLKSGDFDGAKVIITRDLHGSEGSNILDRRLLLNGYLENGDRKEIRKVLNSGGSLSEDPSILASYVALETITGHLNPHTAIGDLYDQAILSLAERGEEERTLLQAGIRLLLDLGQRDMAKRVLICSWTEGRSLWSIETLANLCLREDPGEALSWIEEALAIYPSSARLKLYESRLLLDMGKVTEAERVLSSVSIANNWRWGREKETLYEGHAAELEGKYEEALSLYQKITGWSPDHVEAHTEMWISLMAYGLWREARAEARDLAIITGRPPRPQDDIGTLYIDNRLIPMLVGDGKHMPSPGAYLENSISPEDLPSPEEIINSFFCKVQGEACPLLLALSYEQSGDLLEAVAMWSSFLKRHRLYWPGYRRIVQIYQKMDKKRPAEEMRHMACDRIRQIERAIVTPCRLDALESWKASFCSK